MSLLAGVRGLTPDVARRQPPRWHRSIEQILQHVANCKLNYMTQAFGPPPAPPPPMGDSLESLLAYLEAVHRYVVACLEKSPEQDLGRPVPTQFHGKNAGNLFWVLAQHDVAHGGQIEILRAALER